MRLGMSQSNLNEWVVLAMGNKSDNVMTVAGSRSVAELEEELAKMRRELHGTRQERDILKKQRRTLHGSRYPVRARENIATPLSCEATV